MFSVSPQARVLEMRPPTELGPKCMVHTGAIPSYLLCYPLSSNSKRREQAAIPDRKSVYQLTEEAIQASSSMGAMAFTWRALSGVRRQNDLVLLAIHGANYSTILPRRRIGLPAVTSGTRHGARTPGF